MTKIGDLVTIPDLGDNDLYAVIGQAEPKGYWVQNQRTGALPVAHRPYVSGWLPKEMISTGGRHVTYAGLACQIAGTVHSDDVVEHFSGSTTPELVCGYHMHARIEWRNQNAN